MDSEGIRTMDDKMTAVQKCPKSNLSDIVRFFIGLLV